ncbi:MAG: ubiquinol-cytochrome C chaperone family protein [Xanthobacteraceae bacterium]
MSSLFRWPLGRRDPATPSPATIEAIYGAIVAQARLPVFYEVFGVPDTVEGRFDMVLLHLWMVLHRLRQRPDGERTAQMLFDHFCSDMDANLREMGVGDLAVPKRMRAFGEAFYGRARAYDAALAESGAALAAALARNVCGDPAALHGERLAGYVGEALASLEAVEDAALCERAALPFPEPAR